jgi:hypothetical protein
MLKMLQILKKKWLKHNVNFITKELFNLHTESISSFIKHQGVVVVMIIWELDLQLPMQSMPITTKLVSLNPDQGEVYWIQHYVIKFVSY